MGTPKNTPMDKLSLWDKNPRTIKDKRFKALCKSLTSDPAFMELRPVLATKDGRIYAGNMRYRAAKELGWKEIPAIITDIPETLAKERAVKDNNQFGEWETGELAALLDELEAEGVNLETLGLDESIEKLIESLNPTEIVEDEAPPLPPEAKTKLGDLYQLGEHRLLCGDATKLEDVERLMDGQKADMVFTDPPYNIASDSTNFARDVSKSMNDLANAEWDHDFDIESALASLMEFASDKATAYVCTSHFLFSRVLDALKPWANFVSYCIWSKPNPMPSLSKRHWTWNTEIIVYATREGHTFNFPDGSHALSTWTINKSSDGTHPTQKPVELCVHAVAHSSKKGDSVLDLFGGSGSTLIACEQLNRKCYMMELDPKYCDVIVARWEKLTGKTATPLKNG